MSEQLCSLQPHASTCTARMCPHVLALQKIHTWDRAYTDLACKGKRASTNCVMDGSIRLHTPGR